MTVVGKEGVDALVTEKLTKWVIILIRSIVYSQMQARNHLNMLAKQKYLLLNELHSQDINFNNTFNIKIF